MTLGITFVVAGLLLLTLGGDRLVAAAAHLAKHWGLSPLLVGALVVGMGTSAPELLVSVVAAAQGGLDLAVGNVAGSNVANVSLVLGLSILIAPIYGRVAILRREGAMMVAAVTAMTLCLWNGHVSRLEGVALTAGMALSAALMIQWARREHAARAAALEAPPVAAGQGKPVRAGVEIAVVVGALVALVGGADLLVRGAQVVARSLGLSEAFIGLTLVALGTSLPELATSIASSIRRENDLLIGNVLGSNLFNSLAVLGLSAVVGPGALDADFRAVSVAMVVISVLAGLFVWSGDRLVRIEGAILVAAYGTFVYFSR